MLTAPVAKIVIIFDSDETEMVTVPVLLGEPDNLLK